MLLTKLYRPPVTQEHVYRNHLIDLLNKNQYKPLTLVSAGAGYGKSMLISSWLEKSKIPCAWLSLNEDDSNLITFFTGIITSVKKVFLKALDHLSDLIDTATLPELSVLYESLINGLDEIDEDFVLVFDDFHLIKNHEINDLLSLMLRFPPEHLHLVIITRRDPFLDLSSLRAHSRINEIRMADLRFTVSEIIELFNNIFSTKLSTEIANKLFQQTEGWVTGLRLASLIVKADEDANEVFKNNTSAISITSDFIQNEVIINQPEYIRDCLIKLSILDRFCDDIIEEVFVPDISNRTVETSGSEVLQTLLKANLFTISLDHEGKWYRFHHLFQELLRGQLDKKYNKEAINAYHLKASEWFDKNNLMERAVKYAIKAHEIEVAVALVTKYRYELMDTAQMNRLDRLVNLIPEEVIEQTPALLTAKAFIVETRGDLPQLIAYKEKAKAILKGISNESQTFNAIRGEVETLDAEMFLFPGDWKSAIESANRALELLPRNASHIWSYAIGIQVVAYQMGNDMERGTEIVKNVLMQHPILSDLSRTRMELWYSLAYAMEADPTKLKIHALKLLKLGEKHQHLESVVFGNYFISNAHYLLNEFDEAESYLKMVVNDPFVARPFYLAQSAFMLASIYIDKGDLENANNLVEFIVKHLQEAKNIPATTIAKAMQVELAIKEKNIEKALLLNEQLGDYNIFPPLWFVFVPQLTPIKLKLALNTVKSIKDAQQQLNEFEGTFRQTNKKTMLIDVLILQAVAFKAQNNDENALTKITEAISLSSNGNCIRTYVDFGIPLKELLASLLDTSEYKLHIRKLLNAMGGEDIRQMKNIKAEAMNNSLSLKKNPDWNTLSFREREVIKLVGKGLRNKEISDLLFIQTDTVKKHMKRIFEKLEVSNRLMAVKKAEELAFINKE